VAFFPVKRRSPRKILKRRSRSRRKLDVHKFRKDRSSFRNTSRQNWRCCISALHSSAFNYPQRTPPTVQMRRKIAPTCQVNRRLYNRATDRPGFVGIVPRNGPETSSDVPGFLWNCPGIYCNSPDFDQVLHYIRSCQHLPHVSCECNCVFSALADCITRH